MENFKVILKYRVSFDSWQEAMRRACEVHEKCGFVPEAVVMTDGTCRLGIAPQDMVFIERDVDASGKEYLKEHEFNPLPPSLDINKRKGE